MLILIIVGIFILAFIGAMMRGWNEAQIHGKILNSGGQDAYPPPYAPPCRDVNAICAEMDRRASLYQEMHKKPADDGRNYQKPIESMTTPHEVNGVYVDVGYRDKQKWD